MKFLAEYDEKAQTVITNAFQLFEDNVSISS
jgi:hypothetical protein